jgi:hypothetical protein
MAPPTPLAIATQAVNRLVKEESYYHKEQANQEKRIKKLAEDIENNSPDLDSNAEYILKQEVRHSPNLTSSHHVATMWSLNVNKTSTLTLDLENRPGRDQGCLRAPEEAHRRRRGQARGADCHF